MPIDSYLAYTVPGPMGVEHPPLLMGIGTQAGETETQRITTIAEPQFDASRTDISQPKRSPHPVFWVIAVALVVIATTLVVRPQGGPLDSVAFGQLPTTAGARGVFAFSGQLSKGTYGVYVVDTDAMTIWVYEYLAQKGCIRLAGARTWRYDRYLENHNVCDLPPEVVEKMVEEQRQYRLQSMEQQTP